MGGPGGLAVRVGRCWVEALSLVESVAFVTCTMIGEYDPYGEEDA